MKDRGLAGVRLIISDACLGLVEAAAEVFADARWQRCVVHWYRNAFVHVPRAKMAEVALMLKAIHASESRQGAEATAERVRARLEDMKLSKLAEWIAVTVGETLSYHAFRLRIGDAFARTTRSSGCCARFGGARGWLACSRMGKVRSTWQRLACATLPAQNGRRDAISTWTCSGRRSMPWHDISDGGTLALVHQEDGRHLHSAPHRSPDWASERWWLRRMALSFLEPANWEIGLSGRERHQPRKCEKFWTPPSFCVAGPATSAPAPQPGRPGVSTGAASGKAASRPGAAQSPNSDGYAGVWP